MASRINVHLLMLGRPQGDAADRCRSVICRRGILVSDTTAAIDVAACTATAVHHVPMDDVDLRERARAVWLESHQSGAPLSGADLGRLFERTDRWGRKRRQQARALLDSTRSAEPGRLASLAHPDPPAAALLPPAGDAKHNTPRSARGSRTWSTPPRRTPAPERESSSASRVQSGQSVARASVACADDVPLAFRRITRGRRHRRCACRSSCQLRAHACARGSCRGGLASLAPTLSVDGMMVAWPFTPWPPVHARTCRPIPRPGDGCCWRPPTRSRLTLGPGSPPLRRP